MQRTPQRLLLCSDIHGAYAVVDQLLHEHSGLDGLIIAGDLTTHGSAEEARKALRHYAAHIPVAIVAGNMDPRPIETAFADHAHLIDGRAVRWGSTALFGVSGSPPTPMHTPYEITEDEILQRAERGWSESSGATIRIFVPHAPPANTTLDLIRGGRHVGSTAVRSFVDHRQPELVVCGHIHEARGVESLGRSIVVNCGPAHEGFHALATISDSVSVELRP